MICREQVSETGDLISYGGECGDISVGFKTKNSTHVDVTPATFCIRQTLLVV